MTELRVMGEEREVRLGPDVMRYGEVGRGPTLVFVHGMPEDRPEALAARIADFVRPRSEAETVR